VGWVELCVKPVRGMESSTKYGGGVCVCVCEEMKTFREKRAI
jgi:hypothetical protein